MALNENPEAVKFCNERIRPVADRILQGYYFAKIVQQEWFANDMGSKLPLADTVADGAATDGRHPMTGNAATLIISRCEELIALVEASGALNTLLAVATNPQP